MQKKSVISKSAVSSNFWEFKKLILKFQNFQKNAYYLLRPDPHVLQFCWAYNTRYFIFIFCTHTWFFGTFWKFEVKTLSFFKKSRCQPSSKTPHSKECNFSYKNCLPTNRLFFSRLLVIFELIWLATSKFSYFKFSYLDFSLVLKKALEMAVKIEGKTYYILELAMWPSQMRGHHLCVFKK
jgi:hypothetical protein